MNVQWREVHVDVPGKRILHPNSLDVQPGRMVALMGPSGSGKTTLLSCLRNDIPHKGTVLFDGAPFSADVRQSIGFVEQEDVIIPQMTVRASLLFLAEMRYGVGSEQAQQRVIELIQLLKLDDVADCKVGVQGAPERISGGQKKRLCIARELLSDPRLLLCDEPTSGLDSAMAEQVVDSMRRLCDTGKVSVISSIHQPSTSIFEKFDDIILLKHGQVVYSGPVNNVLEAFTSHGPPRSPSQSVSEYIMDCLVMDRDPSEALKVDELTALEQKKASALPEPVRSKPKPSSNRYEAPFVRQVRLLFRRHSRLVINDIFTWQTTTLNVGLIFIAGLLWWQLDFTDAEIHPRFGACCWVMGTWMFFPLFGSVGAFMGDRPVLEKELKVGCYSLPAYYSARTLLTLPIEWAWPVVWSSSVFWMTNLNPSFSIYLVVVALTIFCYSTFQAVGLVIAASNMPMHRASTVSVLLITYFFGWSGLLMDMERVPAWIRWGADVNIFKSVVSLMYRAITDGLEHVCTNGVASHYGCEDGIISPDEARMQMGVLRQPFTDVVAVVLALVAARITAYCLLRRSMRVAIDGVSIAVQHTALPEKVGDTDTAAQAV